MREMHIKTVRVTNPKNVLVQIPTFVASMKWALTEEDVLEVYISEDEQSIRIIPKKIQARRDSYDEGARVVRDTT